MRERFRRDLPDEVRQRLQLDRWQEPLVRQTYLGALLGVFEDLLAQFDWEEVSLDEGFRRVDGLSFWNDLIHLSGTA